MQVQFKEIIVKFLAGYDRFEIVVQFDKTGF